MDSSTITKGVSSGAIRVEFEDSRRGKAGDVAILRNQEARTVRFIGPYQNDHPAGTEVRTLLRSERIEEREGSRVVTDVDSEGRWYVSFWIDSDDQTWGRNVESEPQHIFEGINISERLLRLPSQGSCPQNGCSRTQVPEALPFSPPVIDLTGHTPARYEVPQEEQQPEGCSLMSMEPLQQWFCKEADVTSPAEYKAALLNLENNPPDIRDLNDNIREESLREVEQLLL